jgi:tRNA U55 pseudouridine synthase TruB
VGLRRTVIGGFESEVALDPARLEDEAAVAAAAIAPLDALKHMPTLVADDFEAGLLSQGRPLQGVDEGLRGLVAVAHAGALLAVGESSSGVLRPRKVFGV